jgi:hypothetical protein
MAHGDYTGQSKARLAQQFAEEQRLAAQSKTLVTQIVTEGRDEVIDLFNDIDHENLENRKVSSESDGEIVEVDSPDPAFAPVDFRASEDLDQVTVGQGREFNLKAGRVHRAPRWVVQHLDAQGLVYH